MEIFRELGLEDAICSLAPPPEHNAYTGYYAGLAGSGPDWNRPILRLGYWDRGGQEDDWRMASTVRARNLMQSQLEPLMRAKAELMAPDTVFFYHEYVEFEQNADGVLATIEDRATGERYQVFAKYLLAFDGSRLD
jgi:2,4-dichlorophenol 6-monooxygenase